MAGHFAQILTTMLETTMNKYGIFGNCIFRQNVDFFLPVLDHSPFRKTFELGKFISTGGKSILNVENIVL